MYIEKYFMLYNMCVPFIGFVNNIYVCMHYMDMQSSKRFPVTKNSLWQYILQTGAHCSIHIHYYKV